MKNVLFVLAISYVLSSCTKSDTAPNPNMSSYDFSDLLPTENLIDSMIIFHPVVAYPGVYKFHYTNKQTIKGIYRDDYLYSYRGSDTMFYSSKVDSVRVIGENAIVPGLFQTTTTKYQYSGSLLSRAYNYEDDYYIPSRRQLGSYISYTNGSPTNILFKYWEPAYADRDSVTIIIKRKPNYDIDTAKAQGTFSFEYSTTINKLNGNANLKIFRYSMLYHPVDFDFYNIEGYNPTLITHTYINELFYDVLFSSNFLPSKFNYHPDPFTTLPFYIKYKFNANNYVTSISIGKTAGFNPVTNERIKITYH